MDREALFPDAHRDGQADRVADHWDLSWPVPIPRFPLLCPACSAGNPFPAPTLVLKDWKPHTRAQQGSKSPWRCDVRLKCVACSLVVTYGVSVPRAVYDRIRAHLPRPTAGWIHWREAKRLLAEAGFFGEE